MMNNRMGIKHWYFQRISNAVLVVFGVVFACILAGDLSYDSLQSMFSNTLFKVYLGLTLVFACGNSILAGWQIAGDYAKKFHINHDMMVGFGAVVSVAYLIVGFILLV